MRGFFATGLLLLQVPVLTHGLPILSGEAEDEGSPIPALTTATLHPLPNTPPVRGSPTQNVMILNEDEPAKGDDVPATSDDESAKDDSYLARELADLQTLRVQLAALAKEVHARERWLAEAVGATPTAGVADCDSVVCVIRTIFRKTKYAAQGTVSSNGDDTNDHRLNQTIPLPPWRRPQGNDTDPSNPTDSDPSNEDNVSSDDGLLNFLSAEVLFLLAFNVLCFIGFSLVRVLFLPRPAVDPESLHREACAPEREVSAREWREFGEQVARGGGSCFPYVEWWRGQSGQSEVSPESEEWVRAGAGPGEEDWDEKGGYVDEKVPRADEGDEDYESESDEELRVLGEEISSFRSALALVEDLVAEGERTEERRR